MRARQVESNLEGRCLALDALCSLTRVGLFAAATSAAKTHPAGVSPWPRPPLLNKFLQPQPPASSSTPAAGEEREAELASRVVEAYQRRSMEHLERLSPARRSYLSTAIFAFFAEGLPGLLQERHTCIRASAAALWVRLNAQGTIQHLMIGKRLEGEGQLPAGLWRTHIRPFFCPFLVSCGYP